MDGIITNALTKNYGSLCAVDGLTLKAENEIYGLLGPNGSGKTTTVRMLTTLLSATSGSAEVCGYDIAKEKSQVRSCISYVPQDMAVDIRLTGRENVDLFAKLYGIRDKAERKRIVADALEVVNLTDRADSMTKTYSGGMKRRLELAQALVMYSDGVASDDAPLSLRDTVAAVLGLSYDELKKDPSAFNLRYSLSNGALIEYLYNKSVTVVKMTLAGATCGDILNALGKSPSELNGRVVASLKEAMGKIADINRRILDSKEMDSLMNGLNGGYIPPGPSGLVIRGRVDVLPSGRNFYSLDPTKVPTTSAWRVGERLADALLDKYLDEEGKYPENVAFYWMCSDIMTADGEMMAEIFSLLGVVPVWNSGGQVKSFEVVPADKLVHPRIDVTIRISGILRDNFMGAVNLVDSAIAAVSVLDEPDEINYVKKHVAEKVGKGVEFTTSRLRLIPTVILQATVTKTSEDF